MPSGPNDRRRAVAPTCPTAQMVQRFDAYLYRSARAPCPPRRRPSSTRSARALPSLKQTLERVDDARPQCAGRAAADVAASARPDRPLSATFPRLSRPSATAKASASTSGWSKASPRAAPRSPRFPRSSRAPTSPRSRPRAASSSRATARNASTARPTTSHSEPLLRAGEHRLEARMIANLVQVRVDFEVLDLRRALTRSK